MKKHEVKKVSRMVDELFTYFMMRGGCRGSIVRVDLDGEGFRVRCFFRGVRLPGNRLDSLRKKLGVPRNPELEDYYWQLAGEDDAGNELMLVAMMSDSIEIRQEAEGVRIKVVRLSGAGRD